MNIFERGLRGQPSTWHLHWYKCAVVAAGSWQFAAHRSLRLASYFEQGLRV